MFQRALDNDEEPTEVVLKGIAIICYIIFGALESGANYFQTGAANNELRELHSVIDNILIQIRSLSSAIPIMDLLLSPVFAANVALAVSLKLYDTAHYRLESLLCKLTDEYANCQIRRLFAPYSELLWSQLIQLRASLPTRLVDSGATVESARVSLKLPKHIVDSHAALCNSISELGVYPHHVSLNNDWNLVEALRVSGILNMPKRVQKQSTLHCSCRALHRVLMRVNSECIRFSFGNTDLKIRGTCQDIKSAIPHSLILAGPSMIELDLSGTGLRRLPLHFGLYFPKLQVRVCAQTV